MRVALDSRRFGQEFADLVTKTTDGDLDNYLVGKNKWGQVSLFRKNTSCIVLLFYRIFCGYNFNTNTLFEIKERIDRQFGIQEVDAVHAQDHIKLFLASKSIEHIATHVMAKRAQKRTLRHQDNWVALTERINQIAQTLFQYIAIEKDRSEMNYASSECAVPTAADIPANLHRLWKDTMLTETLRAVRNQENLNDCQLPTRDLIKGALKRNDIKALVIIAKSIPQLTDIPTEDRQQILFHLMDQVELERAKELLPHTDIDNRKLAFVGSAIYHDDIELANEFLDKNAGPDPLYKKKYPVHMAYEKENILLLFKLYEKGSRVTLKRNNNQEENDPEENNYTRINNRPIRGFRDALDWLNNLRQLQRNEPREERISLPLNDRAHNNVIKELDNRVERLAAEKNCTQQQIEDAQELAQALLFGEDPAFTHARTLDEKLAVFNLLEPIMPGIVSENKMSLFTINKAVLSTYRQEIPAQLPAEFNFRRRLLNLKNIVGQLDPVAYRNITNNDMNGLSNFIRKCQQRYAQTGTPERGSAALEHFYQMVERAIGQAVIAIEQKQTAIAAEQNAEIAANKKTELATVICKIIHEIGEGATACGGRTLSTAVDAFRMTRVGNANTFATITDEALGELRSTLFDATMMKIEGNHGEIDAHNYNRVLQSCGAELGIPATGIYNQVHDTAVGGWSRKEEFLEAFFENYTPQAIFSLIRNKIMTEGPYRELYIDWWKTNIPNDWKTKERNDEAYAFIKGSNETMAILSINNWRMGFLSKDLTTDEQKNKALNAFTNLELKIPQNAFNVWWNKYLGLKTKEEKDSAIKELQKLVPIKPVTDKQVDDYVMNEFLGAYVLSEETGQVLDSGIMKMLRQQVKHIQPK